MKTYFCFIENFDSITRDSKIFKVAVGSDWKSQNNKKTTSKPNAVGSGWKARTTKPHPKAQHSGFGMEKQNNIVGR